MFVHRHIFHVQHKSHSSRFVYLADLKPKHLLEVRRLADEKQVESPTSAEISHDDGVHRHGRKEGPPWRVEFLQHIEKCELSRLISYKKVLFLY